MSAPHEAGSRGRILYFGPWFFQTQRYHHLLRELQALGFEVEVFWGEGSRKRFARDRHRWPEAASIPSQVYRWHRPFGRGPILRHMNRPFRRMWVDRVVAEATGTRPLILWYGWPDFSEWIDRLRPDLVVFDVVDDHRDFHAVAGGMTHDAVTDHTKVLLGQADLILCTSRRLIATLKGTKCEPIYLSNGCDPAHFESVAPLPNRRRVFYVGALECWFDHELLAAAAEALPDVDFDLYGPKGPALDAPLPPNVHWHGPVLYSELPRAMDGASVGIIPFRADLEMIQATNPIKFFEYQAAGLPVVATDMFELRPFQDPDHLAICGTREAFVEALSKFLREESDDALRLSRCEERRRRAAEFSWSAMARRLQGELASRLAERPE